MSQKTNKGITRKYSDAFKRGVVEAIEEEGYTQSQASRLYGCSRTSIQKWIKKYGKNHLLNKVVKIQTMDEATRIQQLAGQVRKLKEALAEAHMDQKLAENRLKLACRELDIDPEEFKKKHDMR